MANPALEKFGYPETLIDDFGSWVVLLRPAQVTLGSLVLASVRDSTAYGDLPEADFADQRRAVAKIETALKRFSDYERINYLMLMMVDPNVHFHVFPRYSGVRDWSGTDFSDAGWPGPPALKAAVDLDRKQIASMRDELKALF